MANVKPKRFGDLNRPFGEEFEYRDIDTLLGKEVKVLDAATVDGQFGSFMYILFEDEESGVKCVTRTGGQVIMRKVTSAKEKGYLPLLGKIEKPGRYYDIN